MEIERTLEAFIKLVESSDIRAGTALKAQLLWYYKSFVPYVTKDVRDRATEALKRKLDLDDSILRAIEEVRTYRDVYSKLGGEVKFSSLLPKEGFLAEYLEYNELNEGPELFHFWCGVTIAGCAIQRRAWFDKGYYKVYPNFFVILVAPSGRCRKTFTATVAIELVRQAGLIPVIAEKITPEALITALRTDFVLTGASVSREGASGLIFAPELAVFLGKQKYNEGLVALLTTLFDCPSEWTYQTRGTGRVSLFNVFLAMIGASTPDWLATAIPETAFGGGFMSRVIFACLEDSYKAFPVPQPKGTTESLVNRLKDLKKVEGPFVLTSEASGWYEAWYLLSRHREKVDDWRLAGYYERKPDHLLRLALMMAASQGTREISIQILDNSLQLLEYTEVTMPSAFQQIDLMPIGRDQLRMLKQLKRAGGSLPHSVFLRMNVAFMDASRFRAIIETLKQSKLIEEVWEGKSHFYVLMDASLFSRDETS